MATQKKNRTKVGGVQAHKWKDGEPVIGTIERVSERKTRFGERLVVKLKSDAGESIVLYLPLSHREECEDRMGKRVTIEREGTGLATEYFYS